VYCDEKFRRNEGLNFVLYGFGLPELIEVVITAKTIFFLKYCTASCG
jgi:hypothetical protein